MLLTFKRITQLFPILLVIAIAIIATSYRDEIINSVRDSVEENNDTISGRILGTVVEGVLPDEDENVESEDAGYNVSESVSVVTEDSEYELEVEIADTEEERLRGLMYRESLCENCGMLFLFSDDTDGGFWMKDCLISLDILFIDHEGLIVDARENFEPCAAYPCPVYDPSHSYRYVLEVNGGWMEDRAVDVGDMVKIAYVE